MRLAVLAAGLLFAPALRAQTSDLVVTFDRATPQIDAYQLVYQLDAEVEVYREGTQFEPVTVGASLNGPPDDAAVRALFESGALSVDITRLAAQLVAFGFSDDADAYEAESLVPAYHVEVSFASWTSTAEVRRAVTAALGVEPGGVTKSENVLRLRVAAAAADALATALRAANGVVAAQVIPS